MSSVPKNGDPLLLMLGFTIPNLPDVRVGVRIDGYTAGELGEVDYVDGGGWMLWNTDTDWFVVGASEPLGWASVPSPPEDTE